MKESRLSRYMAGRKQKRKRFMSLRTKLIVVIMVALITIVLLAIGLDAFLRYVSNYQIKLPLILELVILCMAIGAIASTILLKLIYEPINELREAILKVSEGDFDVTLKVPLGTKEIRDLYQGFNMMTQQLRSTEILQTDFVSNVSHEFKTPINAIEGYATLLQNREELSETEQDAYVNKILFNTRRLSNLVSDILLLSKLDNDAIQPRQVRFRLDEQIRQSIVALESDWVRKDIEFEVEMEEIEITGSESLLFHVWNNLIGNAIKFNPAGGKIRITLTARRQQVIFEIEDSGPGIPPGTQKRIFEKFYQGDSSHKAEGNGLGLALVKQILFLCDGEVAAENLSAGGCRFTVTLKTESSSGPVHMH